MLKCPKFRPCAKISNILTIDQKLAAIKFFESRILRSDGQSYEDLFCEVMEAARSGFQRVNPQGRIGDRKNDGFDASSGLYCQVYAPQNLLKSEGDAMTKLKEDFAGLIDFWPKIAPIKSFWFVLNDKYKGATPSIHALISELRQAHGIECGTFLNKDLENLFESLPDHKMQRIIGSIPSPETLSQLEYSALNDVIGHLMKRKTVLRPETRPENLDFIKKIEFNGLTDYPSNLLKVGDYQRSEVETYFSSRENATILDIQQRFIELYREGQQNWHGLEGADNVFYHILDSSKPSEEAMYDAPVVALMAFYFEKCDIFEPPTNSAA